MAGGGQMSRSSNLTDENNARDGAFSAEIQSAVRAELDMMLKAPIFVQSSRCKRYLSHVVLQTLAGNAGQLKERIIGISVFERPNDFDTGDDSIVRVTANEVRKRLGQFYGESRSSHPIHIDLPKGAYVPEFRINPVLRNNESEEILPSPTPERKPDSGETYPIVETTSASAMPSEVPVNVQSLITDNGKWTRFWDRKLQVAIAVLALLLAGSAIFWVVRGRAQNKVPHLWGAFLNSKVPVLICLGAHDLHLSKAGPGAPADKFADLVLHKQIIAVDDAAVISSMASVLGKKGIPFRVAGADETSLTDFRRQPVILIGAVGNKWTLRLTQDLRYRIEVAYPSGDVPIASIVDAKQPANNSWKIDFSTPMSSWKNDYAIVARLDDSTTGVPVMIEAGLGNDGSIAASELITSPALTDRLAEELSCRGKSNFEAVLGTEIIDTKSGPPHILRLNCW
jgi:hypothetical protein